MPRSAFPELWRHDGETLYIYYLTALGTYVLAKKSRSFPVVTGQACDAIPRAKRQR